MGGGRALWAGICCAYQWDVHPMETMQESHGQQHSAGVRVKYLPVLLRMHKSQGLIEHHHPLPWHWDKPWHFGWMVPHLETKTIFGRCLFESMKNPLMFEFTTLACGNLSKVSLKTRTALHRTMPPTEEVAGSHFGSLYSQMKRNKHFLGQPSLIHLINSFLQVPVFTLVGDRF